MAVSEYRRLELKQRELNRKLDEIAMQRVMQKYSVQRKSYCMYTPREALQPVGKKTYSCD